MNKRTWALVMGAPALSSCWFCGSGHCGANETIAWNGVNADGTRWDGGQASIDCLPLCPDSGFDVPYNSCRPADAGLVTCSIYCLGGRAPPGLGGLSSFGSSVGSSLSAMAQLETAAVHAFWQLAAELEAHGLPGDAARRSADDEVRHARATTKLALSHGFLPPLPRVAALTEPRSLEAIAVENAYEGCGRELYGSVINAWQAEHADDAGVRALMREVAPDERQHAVFSMSLAETLMPRLPVSSRRRVREAQERALLGLGDHGLPDHVRAALGLMDSAQSGAAARRLLSTSRV